MILTNYVNEFWFSLLAITLAMLGGAIGSSYRVSTSSIVSNLFFAIFSARTHANLFCLLQLFDRISHISDLLILPQAFYNELRILKK